MLYVILEYYLPARRFVGGLEADSWKQYAGAIVEFQNTTSCWKNLCTIKLC
jgi:hypothetical protein